MLGTLTDAQIDDLLKKQTIGRLGYRDDRKCYITPVTYAYDGMYIYGQSNEGMKLNIIRNNPYVCFEVDSILNMANWESILLWGHFEELDDDTARRGREYLYNHLLDQLTSSTIHLQKHGHSYEEDDKNRIKQIVYRIHIAEKTGRFEKQ
jgi:nitroimidazol reductase NimA-like FMN-containing flavoprotein (pyridoxamine 5'-phosphate oxidase superfamily)